MDNGEFLRHLIICEAGLGYGNVHYLAVNASLAILLVVHDDHLVNLKVNLCLLTA